MYCAALAICEPARELDYDNVDARALCAECHMSLFDFAGAISDLEFMRACDAAWEDRLFEACAMKSATHYDVLGVRARCTVDEAKEAYKQLRLVWHPDKAAARSAEATQRATNVFVRLKAAYDVISDAAARRKYDQLAKASGWQFHASLDCEIRCDVERQVLRREDERLTQSLVRRGQAVSSFVDRVIACQAWPNNPLVASFTAPAAAAAASALVGGVLPADSVAAAASAPDTAGAAAAEEVTGVACTPVVEAAVPSVTAAAAAAAPDAAAAEEASGVAGTPVVEAAGPSVQSVTLADDTAPRRAVDEEATDCVVGCSPTPATSAAGASGRCAHCDAAAAVSAPAAAVAEAPRERVAQSTTGQIEEAGRLVDMLAHARDEAGAVDPCAAAAAVASDPASSLAAAGEHGTAEEASAAGPSGESSPHAQCAAATATAAAAGPDGAARESVECDVPTMAAVAATTTAAPLQPTTPAWGETKDSDAGMPDSDEADGMARAAVSPHSGAVAAGPGADASIAATDPSGVGSRVHEVPAGRRRARGGKQRTDK